MNNVYVFQVNVNRWGTDEVVKKLFFLGYSLFQVSHIAAEKIFGEDLFNYPVEIGSISKVVGVGEIENPDFILDQDDEENDEDGYDPELPYKIVSNLPEGDSRVMKFKCSCKEEIRVHKGDWLFIECHNCHNKIYRKEVEEVGNMFLYVKRNIDNEE